ncbi:ficolin-1-like [Saccostrea cucullata]|uniref:ficolin-1-like n=1 Tax=Saccostrea cuccullata TaxID=36930 RepID=UPI002ED1E404
MSSTTLLTEYSSPSLSHCLGFCSSPCGCNCLGFNNNTEKCRVLKSCDTVDMTITEAFWRYYIPTQDLPGDCKTLYDKGCRTSGVYTIYPWVRYSPVCRSTNVFCDMEAGGWTAIQMRKTGSVNFTRNWNDYKVGFGNPETDYWIGNDAIHQLTKDRPSLNVSITLNDVTTKYQVYHEFSVSDENDNYTLFLAGPVTGTLSDKMLHTDRPIAGMAFSTHDRDNDRKGEGYSCAVKLEGGWWFNNCHQAFLNGPWAPGIWREPWSPVLWYGSAITETRMMIRPR